MMEQFLKSLSKQKNPTSIKEAGFFITVALIATFQVSGLCKKSATLTPHHYFENCFRLFTSCYRFILHVRRTFIFCTNYPSRDISSTFCSRICTIPLPFFIYIIIA